MRLFGKVDGSIDRYDRASWLSIPFDLGFARDAVGGPYAVVAAQVAGAGAMAAEIFAAGVMAAEIGAAGAMAAEINAAGATEVEINAAGAAASEVHTS